MHTRFRSFAVVLAFAASHLLLPALAGAQSAELPLVVVDAGHGGVDPGARGPAGTREKDIALVVARRLAAKLRQSGDYEVRMTRDRDTLIALSDRGRLANLWRDGERPALFVSVHCNANPDAAGKGFETYFLSEAKTEDARRVERMENAARKYEVRSAAVDPLHFIFHDLRQNKYLRDSSDLASYVQARLGAVHPGPNRGVKQAGFAVLNGSFMPAVLVEIGFISNAREELLLRDATQQETMADGIALAVDDFFAAPSRRPAASR